MENHADRENPNNLAIALQDEEKISSLKDATAKSTTPAEGEKLEPEYVTGVKFWTILGSITLVVFLMMLDTSIIATASLKSLTARLELLTVQTRQYLGSPPIFTLWMMSDGMEALTSYAGMQGPS
jgi:hypothetical protein